MHPIIKKYEEKKIEGLKHNIVDKNFKVGDTLKIQTTIKDGEKQWKQTSQGVCISKRNKGLASSYSIKRTEKDTSIILTFPLYMNDVSVDVLKKGKVRRSKLYYLQRCSRKKGEIKAMLPTKAKKNIQNVEGASEK